MGRELNAEHDITGLVVFNYQGSQSHLTDAQESALVAWVGRDAATQ